MHIPGHDRQAKAGPYDEVTFLGLFEHMPSGVAIYKTSDDGASFIIVDINPAAEKIEKLKRADVIGKRVDEVFTGVSELGLLEIMRRVWKTGSSEYLPKAMYKDSRVAGGWRENWVYKIRTGEIVAVYNDISERVRVEEEVENQKNLFKNLISNIPHAIFWKDVDSVYFGCNENFARIAGVGKPENILGKTDYDLPWSRYQADSFVASDRQVMSSGMPMLDREDKQRQADGREATVLISKVPLRDSKGNVIGLLGIYNDITDRKQSETAVQKAYDELKIVQADLIQSEKMAAIGRFSAGIAHEVKNPLAVIVGCAELLENKMPHYDLDAMDTLEKIKEAALRANSILVSLLQYARPSELKAEMVGPEELIYGVLPLFEKRAKEASVTIIKEFSSDNIRLSVDKNQMHQVIFNVIKNAIEAMPEGGKLTIRSSKMIVAELSYSRESCVVEFRDTGCGINKENIAKIAEPFFSTKARVAGTGLGLFMVKSILDRHKGKLLIDSESGRGTSVKVVLPIANG